MRLDEADMRRWLRLFASEDSGQDLIEYTLLVAFVALSSVGLFLSSGASVAQIWSTSNSVLTAAADGQSPSSGGDQGNGGRH